MRDIAEAIFQVQVRMRVYAIGHLSIPVRSCILYSIARAFRQAQCFVSCCIAMRSTGLLCTLVCLDLVVWHRVIDLMRLSLVCRVRIRNALALCMTHWAETTNNVLRPLTNHAYILESGRCGSEKILLCFQD